MQKIPNKLKPQFRQFEIRQADQNEDRTIEISFSSETEVDRGYWVEILDHSPGAVDLTRLQGKAPLLLNHFTGDQIGVIDSARVNDRKGKAVIRFSKSAKASEIYQDVLDGIRTLVSVGYRILEMVLEKKDGEKEYYRVAKWQPFEISIASIPADDSVGVGRSADYNENEILITNRKGQKMPNPEQTAPAATVATPQIDEAAIRADIQTKEQNRQRDISQMARDFNMEDEGANAISDGTSADEFRKLTLKKILELKNSPENRIDSNAAEVGMNKKEIKSYSLGAAIRAELTGNWDNAGLEREVSAEISRQLQRDPRSFFVPYEVLKREISTGAGGSGLVATQKMPENFIDILRNHAKVLSLGAFSLTGVQGNISIPKATGDPTAYWVTEGSDVTESDATYGSLALSPKTIGAAAGFTRNMLLQGNPDIDRLVMTAIGKKLGLGIDLAAIAGSGAAGEPTGILNTSGIGSVDCSGGLTWAKVVEFETKVAAANADIATMNYLTNATIAGTLKTTEKAANTARFLAENGEVNGYKLERTNQVPASTMLFGAFSELVIAMWGGLDIFVDKYAKAKSGGIVIRGFQSVDIGLMHPGAFSASSNI